ncbi:hypothetical protein PIB30_063327 [Stylosanthes scabra]|uniref:Uncharacterized protein n=1 Tax=Stylosanthes scabra TaxID=79078 RepID=A0ABU6UPD4_9FABA|nr:hypothetical protein [Stylosanthes scabra]
MTWIAWEGEQRPEKLSLRKQLKLKCQEQNTNPVQNQVLVRCGVSADVSPFMTVLNYIHPSVLFSNKPMSLNSAANTSTSPPGHELLQLGAAEIDPDYPILSVDDLADQIAEVWILGIQSMRQRPGIWLNVELDLGVYTSKASNKEKLHDVIEGFAYTFGSKDGKDDNRFDAGTLANGEAIAGFFPKHSGSGRTRLIMALAGQITTQHGVLENEGGLLILFLTEEQAAIAAAEYARAKANVAAHAVVDYVTLLLMPLYKARKLDKDAYKALSSYFNYGYSEAPEGELTILIEGQTGSEVAPPSDSELEDELRELIASVESLLDSELGDELR